MKAEMQFHGLPYEYSGDDMPLATWRHVSRRMQVGFILHRAVPNPVDGESIHRPFLARALGDDLDLTLAEIDQHIDRGLQDVGMRLVPGEPRIAPGLPRLG